MLPSPETTQKTGALLSQCHSPFIQGALSNFIVGMKYLAGNMNAEVQGANGSFAEYKNHFL